MSDAPGPPAPPPGMTLAEIRRVMPGAQVIALTPAEADQPLAAGKVYLINVVGAHAERNLRAFNQQLNAAGVRAFVINAEEIQVFELDAGYVERDVVAAPVEHGGVLGGRDDFDYITGVVERALRVDSAWGRIDANALDEAARLLGLGTDLVGMPVDRARLVVANAWERVQLARARAGYGARMTR